MANPVSNAVVLPQDKEIRFDRLEDIILDIERTIHDMAKAIGLPPVSVVFDYFRRDGAEATCGDLTGRAKICLSLEYVGRWKKADNLRETTLDKMPDDPDTLHEYLINMSPDEFDKLSKILGKKCSNKSTEESLATFAHELMHILCNHHPSRTPHQNEFQADGGAYLLFPQTLRGLLRDLKHHAVIEMIEFKNRGGDLRDYVPHSSLSHPSHFDRLRHILSMIPGDAASSQDESERLQVRRQEAQKERQIQGNVDMYAQAWRWPPIEVIYSSTENSIHVRENAIVIGTSDAEQWGRGDNGGDRILDLTPNSLQKLLKHLNSLSPRALEHYKRSITETSSHIEVEALLVREWADAAFGAHLDADMQGKVIQLDAFGYFQGMGDGLTRLFKRKLLLEIFAFLETGRPLNEFVLSESAASYAQRLEQIEVFASSSAWGDWVREIQARQA